MTYPPAPPWRAEFVQPWGWHVVDANHTEAVIDGDWWTQIEDRAHERAAELNAEAVAFVSELKP